MRKFTGLLAGLLLLSSCRPSAQKSVRIDPEIEALIPADTLYLFDANVDRMRQTDVYRKLENTVLPQADRIAKELGVDPRKDIREVLASSNGNDVVTLVLGTFSSSDLEPRLQARGAPRREWKGRTLYGNGEGSLTFLSPHLAAAGTTTALKSIIDADRGTQGIPPALKPLVAAVPERDQMWAVSAGGVPGLRMSVAEGSKLGDIAGMLRGIQAIVLGADFSKGLNVYGRLDCRAEDDAHHVHDALRGAIGIARLSTPDNHPELLQVYDAIQVTQVNSRVEVTGDLPADQVDRFLSQWLKKPL